MAPRRPLAPTSHPATLPTNLSREPCPQPKSGQLIRRSPNPNFPPRSLVKDGPAKWLSRLEKVGIVLGKDKPQPSASTSTTIQKLETGRATAKARSLVHTVGKSLTSKYRHRDIKTSSPSPKPKQDHATAKNAVAKLAGKLAALELKKKK